MASGKTRRVEIAKAQLEYSELACGMLCSEAEDRMLLPQHCRASTHSKSQGQLSAMLMTGYLLDGDPYRRKHYCSPPESSKQSVHAMDYSRPTVKCSIMRVK
jgi:hypothetical protein